MCDPLTLIIVGAVLAPIVILLLFFFAALRLGARCDREVDDAC